ncbi:MAG: FAD-dependent oxidoreductase [Bacillota bacterium]
MARHQGKPKGRRQPRWQKAARRMVLRAAKAGAGALFAYLAERARSRKPAVGESAAEPVTRPVEATTPPERPGPTRTIPNRHDVIVFGAGPAGNTCAYLLARKGLDVLLIERGPVPGSKSIGGAALYVQTWLWAVPELVPALFEEHPYERVITRQEYWLITEDCVVNVGVRGPAFARPPYDRLSALKSRIDPWMAGKAVQAGAALLSGYRVDEIIKDGRQAIGVRVDHEVDTGSGRTRELFADVVVVAEGANPIVSHRAGYVKLPKATTQTLYVKETFALPPEEVSRRLGCPGDEGAVIGLYGYPSAGLNGTGSIYTNRESIGINVGACVDGLAKAGLNPNQFLERVKAHPSFRSLLEGSKTIEYSAHLIPDAGFNGVPKLVHDGAVILGDAASLVNGIYGIVPAMVSAKAAAEAIYAAKERGDFTAKGLKGYAELLSRTFAWRDLRINRLASAFLQKHPRAFDLSTSAIAAAAYAAAMAYPETSRQRRWRVVRSLRKVAPLSRLIREAAKAAWVEY